MLACELEKSSSALRRGERARKVKEGRTVRAFDAMPRPIVLLALKLSHDLPHARLCIANPLHLPDLVRAEVGDEPVVAERDEVVRVRRLLTRVRDLGAREGEVVNVAGRWGGLGEEAVVEERREDERARAVLRARPSMSGSGKAPRAQGCDEEELKERETHVDAEQSLAVGRHLHVRRPSSSRSGLSEHLEPRLGVEPHGEQDVVDPAVDVAQALVRRRQDDPGGLVAYLERVLDGKRRGGRVELDEVDLVRVRADEYVVDGHAQRGRAAVPTAK